MPLLRLEDLEVTYRTSEGDVPAVRGVTLDVEAGTSLGVAGESGSGKSTLAATVLRLTPRSAAVSGRVLLDDEDVLSMSFGRLRAVRKSERIGELVVLSGADPLNLVGILTPETRVPAVHSNRLLLRDGLPIAALEGGEVRRLAESEFTDEQLRTMLARRSLRRPANLHPRVITSREAKALANRVVH